MPRNQLHSSPDGVDTVSWSEAVGHGKDDVEGVMAEIRLFNDSDFKGGEVRITGNEVNLHDSHGLGDRLSSVIVTSGTFTLFRDVNFRGYSFTVSKVGGPNSDGRYPNSDSMAGRNDVVSSIKKNSDQPN